MAIIFEKQTNNEALNQAIIAYATKIHELKNMNSVFACDIEVQTLRTRFRVVVKDLSSGYAHSFIDFDGNVYKPASYRVPAKGIRGSIYGNYGIDAQGFVRYLR